MHYTLTKSKYLNALQCAGWLWLEKNQPKLAAPLSAADKYAIKKGNDVHKFAQLAFDNGVNAYRQDLDEAIEATKSAINKSEVIFEPSFVFDEVLVRSDILKKNSNGWDLIEVKSSTRVKEEFIPDLAIQKYVLEQNGLEINKCDLMFINKECEYPNLDNLFEYQNLDDEINAHIEIVPKKISFFKEVLNSPHKYDKGIGDHCKKPLSCPFQDHCWQSIPKHSIYSVPRLRWEKKQQLIDDGIIKIVDIPDTFPLTDLQKSYVNAVKQESIYINKNGIRDDLNSFNFPIYFLDFETDTFPIPRYEKQCPYDLVPFQYSCHILHEDGSLEHKEFLHSDLEDPRPPFIESLITCVSNASGSIVAYNASFEKRVLNILAESFPNYATLLVDFANRLFDLLLTVRNNYNHPDFEGSFSLKKVLPVLAPDLTYTNLAVQKGDDASAFWNDMIHEKDAGKKNRSIKSLKEYCKLDTLAMVRIYEYLKTVSQ